MDITIRPAQPKDAPFLAWIILASTRLPAFSGWFDIILARPEQECLDFLRELTLTPTPSWWHHSRFLVAEVDNVAVAALTAFRASEGYPLSGAAIKEASAVFGWDEEAVAQMWKRGSYAFTCAFNAGDDLWTIEHVATLPTYRGRGIATALVKEALSQGRRRGFRHAQIVVLIGNTNAERIYSRLGFSFTEKRSAAFEAATGVPGLRHGLLTF